MIRCVPLRLSLALVLALPFATAAQAPRNFPANALRGEIVITQPPELLLNRQPSRLAPGARIRGADNMMILSGAAVGQRLLVNYTLDLQGQVLAVWVLSAAEGARQPWPVTPQEAATWLFNADAQTWSRP